MTMAAPVALAGSGRNGVSAGMSFASLPSAPGAPSGHSGRVFVDCARANTVKQQTPRRVRWVFISRRELIAPRRNFQSDNVRLTRLSDIVGSEIPPPRNYRWQSPQLMSYSAVQLNP